MPRRASSSIHLQKGLVAGTSLNTGVPQAGGLRAGSSVRSTKMAICSRVTGVIGRWLLPPQPATTPRRASSSTHLQKGLLAGTSLNMGVPQGGGGEGETPLGDSNDTADFARGGA